MPNTHDDEIRYSRNISLPEIGRDGQNKLKSAKVLVVGAGGLGSPVLLYLAAAGVGELGIIDDDKVALSNLQRQIIFETGDISRLKVEAASDAISELNGDVKTVLYPTRLDASNASEIITKYDIIADSSDNFETRFLLNEYCLKHSKTLVSGAVTGFAGQLYTFKPYLGEGYPCYRCLYPEAPPKELLQDCANSGVLGSVVGIIGTWQATEIIKELLGIGESLAGNMLIIDALGLNIRKVKINPDPNCKSCGGGE